MRAGAFSNATEMVPTQCDGVASSSSDENERSRFMKNDPSPWLWTLEKMWALLTIEDKRRFALHLGCAPFLWCVIPAFANKITTSPQNAQNVITTLLTYQTLTLREKTTELIAYYQLHSWRYDRTEKCIAIGFSTAYSWIGLPPRFFDISLDDTALDAEMVALIERCHTPVMAMHIEELLTATKSSYV